MPTFNLGSHDTTALQWGRHSPSGWNPSGGSPNLIIGDTVWVVFDLNPAGLEDGIAGGHRVTAVEWTLRTNDPGGFSGVFTLDLLVLNRGFVSDFVTGGLLPTPYTVSTSAAYVITVTPGIDLHTGLTMPMHTSTGQATAVASSLGARWALDSLGRRRWTFGLRLNPQVHTVGQLMPLLGILNVTLTLEPMWTGLYGEAEARGRADECPRCGSKSTRDTWVADGFSKGLMVCPKCYDDEDLVGRHYQGLGSERPGQGEG